MSEKQFIIVGIGEVLFDVLPSKPKMPGGAPANFAYVSKQLGDRGIILSRIGSDELGKELTFALKAKDLTIDYLQIDNKKQTGIVNVTFENGQPSYEIVEDVAWDFLKLTDNWREIAQSADAVCFGTLAQRSEITRRTIREFIGLTKGMRIFDVNLRQNYFSAEIMRASFQMANVVKFNHEELPIISEMLGIAGTSQIDSAKKLLSKFDLDLIAITRGADGSILLKADEISENPGLKVQVKDTIGAGDAFAAGMIHGVLRNWDLNKINQFANQTGAFVASQAGAMPDFSIKF
jgi:fructokinase